MGKGFQNCSQPLMRSNILALSVNEHSNQSYTYRTKTHKRKRNGCDFQVSRLQTTKLSLRLLPATIQTGLTFNISQFGWLIKWLQPLLWKMVMPLAFYRNFSIWCTAIRNKSISHKVRDILQFGRFALCLIAWIVSSVNNCLGHVFHFWFPDLNKHSCAWTDFKWNLIWILLPRRIYTFR